jgi:hypothetical protein
MRSGWDSSSARSRARPARRVVGTLVAATTILVAACSATPTELCACTYLGVVQPITGAVVNGAGSSVSAARVVLQSQLVGGRGFSPIGGVLTTDSRGEFTAYPVVRLAAQDLLAGIVLSGRADTVWQSIGRIAPSPDARDTLPLLQLRLQVR